MKIHGYSFSGLKIEETGTRNSIRDSLSASGQSNFDSATVGNFFEVTGNDYELVVNSLMRVQRVGMNESSSQMNANNTVFYTATCASILDEANTTIPANNYIIGFSLRGSSSVPAYLLLANTYQGTYEAIANSPTLSTTNRSFFLRKNPGAETVTKYFGIVLGGLGGGTSLNQSNATFNGSAFDCTAPYGTWTARNATMPVMQVLITDTKQW